MDKKRCCFSVTAVLIVDFPQGREFGFLEDAVEKLDAAGFVSSIGANGGPFTIKVVV